MEHSFPPKTLIPGSPKTELARIRKDNIYYAAIKDAASKIGRLQTDTIRMAGLFAANAGHIKNFVFGDRLVEIINFERDIHIAARARTKCCPGELVVEDDIFTYLGSETNLMEGSCDILDLDTMNNLTPKMKERIVEASRSLRVGCKTILAVNCVAGRNTRPEDVYAHLAKLGYLFQRQQCLVDVKFTEYIGNVISMIGAVFTLHRKSTRNRKRTEYCNLQAFINQYEKRWLLIYYLLLRKTYGDDIPKHHTVSLGLIPEKCQTLWSWIEDGLYYPFVWVDSGLIKDNLGLKDLDLVDVKTLVERMK